MIYICSYLSVARSYPFVIGLYIAVDIHCDVFLCCRLLSVVTVSAIQGWMVLRFVTFHLRQKRAKKEEMEAIHKKKQALVKATKKGN